MPFLGNIGAPELIIICRAGSAAVLVRVAGDRALGGVAHPIPRVARCGACMLPFERRLAARARRFARVEKTDDLDVERSRLGSREHHHRGSCRASDSP